MQLLPLPDTLRAKPDNVQHLSPVLPRTHRELIELGSKPDPFRIEPPRLGDGRICQILARPVGREAFLFEQEGEAGSGGGGAPADNKPADKTFTQADFDRALGQRLSEERKKFSDYETLKEQAKQAADAQAELTKLREELETKGKSDDEKRRIEADRAAKRIETERQEMQTKLSASEKRAEEAEQRYKDLIVRNGLGSGLDASKVLSSARDKAIKAFRDDSQVDLDDDGKIVSVTYGGIAYKTTAEAAAAFLKDNDFFAAGSVPPGGGTKRPNGGGVVSSGSLFDLPNEQLLQMANEPR